MSEQMSPPLDLVEYWLRLWSEISAPLHSLMQSPVAQAFMQDSQSVLQRARQYWDARPDEFGVHTQALASELAHLLQQADIQTAGSEELQRELQRAQALFAAKLGSLIDATGGLSDSDRALLHFNLRQVRALVDPRNSLLANPEVVRRAAETGGQSLLAGSAHYQDDISASRLGLHIRRSGGSLEPGRDLATTAGAVVYQNDLMQLIHYRPRAPRLSPQPLLIVPPCINRFYIFDLTPEHSMVGWLLDQGFDLYMISWVNPSAALRNLSLNDYVRRGCLQAVDLVSAAAGGAQVHLAGYCIGGLLAALAAATESGQQSIASLSLFASLLDYSEPGELGLFLRPTVLPTLLEDIDKAGVLDAELMALAFTLLREQQLFWNFVRQRYFLGEIGKTDALMHWGQDTTQLPATMAREYLTDFYRDNILAVDGACDLGGEVVDLRRSACPKYLVACESDHIVGRDAALRSAALTGGQQRLVSVSGGHVRGVFNHPALSAGHYEPAGSGSPVAGSWWPDWRDWLGRLPEELPGESRESNICAPAQYPEIEPAPGSYVRTGY